MEALMSDMSNTQTKKSGIHQSLFEVLGWDSTLPGPSIKRHLFTDNSTFSMAGQNPIFPASNQQPTINLRQSNVIIDTHQTYIVGRFACPTGVINSRLGYQSLFQPLDLQIGDSFTQSFAFAHYYNALRKASHKDDHVQDYASGTMRSESDSFVPGSYDSYSIGAIPTIKNVISGTGSTTAVETLDPYQVAMRRNIEDMISRNTGQYMTISGVGQASASVFMVPLCDLCDYFKENRFVFLGLGQPIRMTLKTTDPRECITQCIGSGSPISDYALSNMGIFMSYIPVAEQGNDLQNILRSRVEMKFEKQVTYQILSSINGTLNLQFSISAGDRLRSLMLGFFSNMTSSTVLSDSTNTATNIIPSTSQVANCQYHTCQLAYFPQPAISQVTIQCGSQQIVINSQALQFLDKKSPHYRKMGAAHDNIWNALQNPFILDLTRYTEELDLEGASQGGSTSLLISILLKADTSTGTQSNNNRTLPYQTTDWNSSITQNSLKCMAYVNVEDSVELVNGIYQV